MVGERERQRERERERTQGPPSSNQAPPPNSLFSMNPSRKLEPS
jgi:hypothetical protein